MTFVNARRGMYGSAFRCHLAILQCSVNSRFETEPERVRFGRCVWTCFAFTNFFHEFTLPAKLCDFSRLLHHLAKSLWPRCQCWQLVSAFHSAFLFFFSISSTSIWFPILQFKSIFPLMVSLSAFRFPVFETFIFFQQCIHCLHCFRA